VTPEDILAGISHIKSPTRLDVVVRWMEQPADLAVQDISDETYMITAQGNNQQGLVFQLSDVCRQRNINILDLATRLEDGLYTMIVQVDLSQVDSMAGFRADLDTFSAKTGLGVVLQHNDIFQATSEISFAQEGR
jgi:predicted amino acid-binding ACT domain protein